MKKYFFIFCLAISFNLYSQAKLDSLNNIIDICNDSNLYQKAIETYTTILKLYPKEKFNRNILYKIGDNYLQLNDTSNAMKYFKLQLRKKILFRSSLDNTVYVMFQNMACRNLAYIFIAKGNYKKSIKYFKKALHKYDSYWDGHKRYIVKKQIYEQLAFCYTKIGNQKKAAAYLKRKENASLSAP